MATLSTLLRAFAPLGGESARGEVDRSLALSLNLVHSIVANVPENSGQVVTLWDAALNLATWVYGAILVDPSDEKPTLALPVIVTLHMLGSGTATEFMAHQVTREVPLQLSNRAGGLGTTELAAAVTNFTATRLDKIQVRNTAGVGAPAGSNDVKVRCLLFG